MASSSNPTFHWFANLWEGTPPGTFPQLSQGRIAIPHVETDLDDGFDNGVPPPLVADDLDGHFVVDEHDAITVNVAAAAADDAVEYIWWWDKAAVV